MLVGYVSQSHITAARVFAFSQLFDQASSIVEPRCWWACLDQRNQEQRAESGEVAKLSEVRRGLYIDSRCFLRDGGGVQKKNPRFPNFFVREIIPSIIYI